MKTAHVSVLIERADGSVIYRDWIGTSIKAIHRTARKRYTWELPGSTVSFGVGWYSNSYGAH